MFSFEFDCLKVEQISVFSLKNWKNFYDHEEKLRLLSDELQDFGFQSIVPSVITSIDTMGPLNYSKFVHIDANTIRLADGFQDAHWNIEVGFSFDRQLISSEQANGIIVLYNGSVCK